MKNFTLNLTEQDVQVIGAALGEISFKHANPVVVKIQQQVNQQIEQVNNGESGNAANAGAA